MHRALWWNIFWKLSHILCMNYSLSLVLDRIYMNNIYIYIYNITDGRRYLIAAVSRLKNIRAHQLSSVIGYKGLTIKKMSRTSLVQAEWPVAFKRDFNIITRELSRVALLFHWWAWNLREPSNWSLKSLYKKIK